MHFVLYMFTKSGIYGIIVYTFMLEGNGQMNVLVAYISTINRNDIITFDTNGLCDVKTIQSRQTNETAAKCLRLMLAKKNETIDKIICILSQAARDDIQRGADGLTAYEYFKKSVKNEVSEKYIAQKKLFRKKEPVPNQNNIPTDNDLIKFVEIVTYDADGNEKSMGTLLGELCNEINKDDVVYIDTTGGPRTVLNLIQLLTKILKYKGIKNPCSFYSNIQGDNRFIQTTEETSLMLDIADSLNEFVNTGSSAQLKNLFDVSSPEAVRELLKSMNKFSESMQLCMIRKLDDNLNNLRKCIEDVREIKSESISIVILKNLLPVIEEKFYNQDSIDYLKIISWCLDNGLIQQAITIYIEKIPGYIFDKNIIKLTNEFNTNINMRHSSEKNLCAYKFYNVIMGSYNNRWDEIAENFATEFAQYLNNGTIAESFESFTSDNKKIFEALEEIQKESSMPGLKFKDYLKANLSSTGIKKILIVLFKNGRFKSYKAAIDSISSNPKKWYQKEYHTEYQGNDVFEKKIRTAINLQGNDDLPNGVSINSNIDVEDIRGLMLDYVYMKAIRNQINHAGDYSSLGDNQKNVLESYGFKMALTISDIKYNISKSIEQLEKMNKDIC